MEVNRNSNRKKWTREELLLAINLYCKIPFGQIHVRNSKIIKLAEYLGRTPGSISYKLANFASIDPSLERRGAAHVSKLDKAVWQEIFDNWEEMLIQSEIEFEKIYSSSNKSSSKIPEAKESLREVKQRLNQRVFRDMILSSYDHKCCITGIQIPKLLIASHIKPWAIDKENRLNPQNGLCLNAYHDKAFDVGYLSIDRNYKIIISQEIMALTNTQAAFMKEFNGQCISMPDKFLPSQEFLKYHRNYIFRDSKI